MPTYPVLLSIPHGGTLAPREISSRIALAPGDLFADSDAFTREIYGLGDKVAACMDTEIARVYVDLNRATDDRPPQNPDGVVKTRTCHGRSIYFPGQDLDRPAADDLIEKYHAPYHRALLETLRGHSNIELFLDCHSMEAVGPDFSPDPGASRPSFCLGGNHGQSCPPETVRRLARCLGEAFSLENQEITIDSPFAGGHITRIYGNHPRPGVQIEMNRGLYLSAPWFDAERLTVAPARLAELNRSFERALALFFSCQ